MTAKTLVSAWLPVALLQLVIVGLSAQPNLSISPKIRHLDKVVHFVEYAFLGALFYRASRLSGAPRGGAASLTFLLVGLAGGADEVLQRSVPGRVPSVTDWLADLLGTGVGSGLAALTERWWVPHFGRPLMDRPTHPPNHSLDRERDRSKNSESISG